MLTSSVALSSVLEMFGCCAHCSVASGVNTDADCQIIKLKNKGSLGKQWSLGTTPALSWYGVCMFREKRNRKGSENVGEFEKCHAHMWCLLISPPSCGLWFFLKVKDRSELKCQGKPTSMLTPTPLSLPSALLSALRWLNLTR